MLLRRLAIAVALALVQAPVLAADATGTYLAGGGVGGALCQFFTGVVDRARKQNSHNLMQSNEVHLYMSFVAGFQTAYNQQTPGTCDLFAGLAPEQMLGWLENYCRANPGNRFNVAVAALGHASHPTRSQTCRR